MNYLGFLCLGLGILSLVVAMILGLLAFASHEKAVKAKTKRWATLMFPIALALLTIGMQLSFAILSPRP